MSMRKNLNFLVASSLLVTLISCGNDNKVKTYKEVNPVCSEIDCLSTISWKILLQGRAFPDKARVDINGATVINECVPKGRYTINRWSEPQSIYLENYIIPKRGELKIEVVDLGSDCVYESSLISDNDVEFEVTKNSGVSEVLINL